MNWLDIIIPLMVALASVVLAFWARRVLFVAFTRWARKVKWQGANIVTESTYGVIHLWLLLLGIYVALRVSKLSSGLVTLLGQFFASLFIISLALVVINITQRMLRLLLAGARLPEVSITVLCNIIRIAIAVVTILIFLDIWGVPVTPILVVVAALILVGLVALRDTMPNLFAGFQLAGEDKIREGDFIKLESGEKGYVVEINRSTTAIKTLSDELLLIPNSKLIRTTVINYGRPLKQAKQPFHFSSHLHLHELTGLKATNLPELVNILKNVPDSVIYYHTHNFLEEQQYLTPAPPNDFAPWVSDVLGDEILGEKLASVDTVAFPTLSSLKTRIVNVIEEHLAQSLDLRKAPEGREFHFLKSLSIITPTNCVAHDLREFVEVLRQIPANSLYFHVFESRLRLSKGMNDFSIWLADSLEEKDLADAITQLDPYHYTLEGLRSTVIQLIEKRVK
jgi:hypothetical protein